MLTVVVSGVPLWHSHRIHVFGQPPGRSGQAERPILQVQVFMASPLEQEHPLVSMALIILWMFLSKLADTYPFQGIIIPPLLTKHSLKSSWEFASWALKPAPPFMEEQSASKVTVGLLGLSMYIGHMQ